MKTLLDPSFWPDGVKSKKWIEPNGKGGRPNIYIGKKYQNVKF